MYDPIIEKQSKILGITYPFTANELKHAYVQSVFVHHPDVGGEQEKFIAIQEAYNFLKTFASSEKPSIKERTAEGDLISSLGKGLGDLINQKPCPKCNGNGYVSKLHTHYIYEHKCPNCNGKGFDRFHICFTCLGTGGFGKRTKYTTLLHTCCDCNGTGYIQVMNPVLPKNKIFVKIPNDSTSKKNKRQYCECGAIVSGNKCWRCHKEYRRLIYKE